MDWHEIVDEEGDPIQSGLQGQFGDGISRQPGVVIGIVLSTNAADSEDNLFRNIIHGDSEFATGTPNTARAPYIEANVLVVYSGLDENYVLQNCIVCPSGKTSRIGPSEDEPSDFSEDIPNGCSANELDAFYGGRFGSIEELSGDWVVVAFVGGILQIPLIINWFPNPFNTVDAATEQDGKRFRQRRNNSSFSIDKNGDIALTHRVGQFLQFSGNTISLKHISGSLLNLDQDGGITLLTPDQKMITIDDTGISINNGTSIISVQGDDIRLQAPKGELNISADAVNMMANEVNIGVTGGQALCNETGVTDFAAVTQVFTQILTALELVPIVGPVLTALLLQPLDPTDLTKGTLGQAMNVALGRAKAPSVYLTKNLASE